MKVHNNSFSVILASSPDSAELVAEIYFGDKFVAMITSDHGVDRLEIEMPGPDLDQHQLLRRVDLDGFLNAIEKARMRLKGTD